MGLRQREQALGETAQKGFVHARQAQRQREGTRCGAARGQIAKVDRQRLVAQTLRRDRG